MSVNGSHITEAEVLKKVLLYIKFFSLVFDLKAAPIFFAYERYAIDYFFGTRLQAEITRF